MPLFYQHNINEFTKLAIWHITEEESFFLLRVPVKRDVSHAQKRLQHLAGRYLLTELFSDFPLEEILIADTRKPYLEDEKYHFSISHFGHYAAAIVSRSYRVGVDVEKASPTIEKIMSKFLSDEESAQANRGLLKAGHRLLLTLLWSAKESIFKWYSLGNVNFKEHIRWVNPYFNKEDGFDQLYFEFRKLVDYIPLSIHYKIFNDLVVTFVYT
ncbi:MAG: 4'-phosphopantetheinyl transferase superfamily protein [Bacteroidota bacterium]|nr:4'-phosphopantetheinyl transferase superfamily protein [Bacteroidota bacterium]